MYFLRRKLHLLRKIHLLASLGEEGEASRVWTTGGETNGAAWKQTRIPGLG